MQTSIATEHQRVEARGGVSSQATAQPGDGDARSAASTEAGDGCAVALGTSRSMQPPLVTRGNAGWRRERFRRRQRSSGWLVGKARVDAGLPRSVDGPVHAGDDDWVKPARPARCRWRIGQQVGVHGGEDGPAHFSGTERCGSIWACPVCSAVIRSERAAEIETAYKRHAERGGTVLMLTLTVRHHLGDTLADTLDAVLSGWRDLINGSPWKRQRDRLGIVGYIRSIEITRSQENGWHPHAHALLFLDESIAASQLVDLRHWVYQRWSDRVQRRSGRAPDFEHGVDLRVAGSEDVSWYVAKVQDQGSAHKVASEAARFDLKGGRAGSITPFELLDAETDDYQARALWGEYVEASHGRRAITWSRDLRAHLDLDEERTDEEIIEDSEQSPVLTLIGAKEWDAMSSDPDRLAAVLEAADRGDVDGIHALTRAVLLDGDLVDLVTGEVLDTGPSPPCGSDRRRSPARSRR